MPCQGTLVVLARVYRRYAGSFYLERLFLGLVSLEPFGLPRARTTGPYLTARGTSAALGPESDKSFGVLMPLTTGSLSGFRLLSGLGAPPGGVSKGAFRAGRLPGMPEGFPLESVGEGGAGGSVFDTG